MTTSAPRTQEALHDTANDLRSLGQAVKEDLHSFSHDARARLDGYAHKVADEANQNLNQVRDYTVQNPLRALGYAALGGMVLGLFFRR